jgi:GDP-D-mannose dehydratase
MIPDTTFKNDTIGTFNVLEECRKSGTKLARLYKANPTNPYFTTTTTDYMYRLNKDNSVN